jgi:hypothetical protein
VTHNFVFRADNRPANAGLGQTKPEGVEEEDDEFEIYRKRMMLAYRFRPNPLVREQLFISITYKDYAMVQFCPSLSDIR